MSFSGALLLTEMLTPTRSSSSAATGLSEMTPMEPTIALGSATILVAAEPAMYAPEMPEPRMKATTGFF